MATSYYACDGTVTNIAGGLRCSTTWQRVLCLRPDPILRGFYDCLLPL